MSMFQMMGVLAEFERSMIRERVNAGLQRAREEGKKLGRPRVAPKVRGLAGIGAATTLERRQRTPGGISKRGDGYIRRLLIHGARAVVGWRKRRPMARDPWLAGC